jgi:hypothetical protein
MRKLRSLINITEQAPMPMGGAPIPAQLPPQQNIPQNQPTEEPTPEPEVDNNPQPEDPSEYDWTRDFRSFEDAKNKAESAAKKKLLDKMNKMLLGKKATINASRGYGQPKTDYTLDKIKKISVEFWYKEWVIIMTDENDKKYFLTPGVNIKIEGGSAEAPDTDEVPQETDSVPGAPPEAGSQEQPNSPPPETNGEPTSTAPVQPGQPGSEPQAQQPEQEPVEQPPVLKKKRPVAESFQRDLNSFLTQFMADHVKDVNGNVKFTSYIKSTNSMLNENKNVTTTRASLEIPMNDMISPLDIREVKLAVKESLWSSGNRGERFSNGSIDIDKVGRLYVISFVKESGWKS